MKKYTVRYSWGNHVYESEVRASSTLGALMWAERVLNGSNAKVVKEEELEE